MLTYTPRARDCEHCRKTFQPARPLQSVCSQRCARALVAARTRAKKAQARADLKARTDAVARINDLHALAQKAFNEWVRLRDADLPCISCGTPPPDLTQLHAGRDAGHYRSVGSAAHLRYHEDNVHGQCVHCNQFGAGKAVDYRIGLVERIGLARVEALETSNAPHKWTREEIVGKRDTYRARVREMKRQAA